jgi:hypothetical protein
VDFQTTQPVDVGTAHRDRLIFLSGRVAVGLVAVGLAAGGLVGVCWGAGRFRCGGCLRSG